MSSLTEKDIRELDDVFLWRCFGTIRVSGASIDGEPVSCHLIIRENGQFGKNVLADLMKERILSWKDQDIPVYRGDNCE